MNKIDIIVPVLNEEKNLSELINRIGMNLNKAGVPYGIIVVDDHSTDKTNGVVRKLSAKYPITFLSKQGKTGKAYSLLEGIEQSQAEYVAMIDGDLQYSPEHIPEMLKKAEAEDLGIVIGSRTVHNESLFRRFASSVGHIIYAKLILGMNSDTQSGLKLFRRGIISFMETKDIKPWAFDLPLIHTAMQLGMKIGSVNIDFQKRKNGKSKVNFILGTFQILLTAILLRLKANRIFNLVPDSVGSMIGSGVIYKRRKFITHTTLHHSKSALITFTSIQKAVLLSVLASLIVGLTINPQTTLIIFIAILSAVYFMDVFFGLFLVLKSLHHPPEMSFNQKRLDRVTDQYLPIYSILCPLYREVHVLPQFVENIGKLDWPKEKLDVILLLEEDDKETIEAAKKMDLPSHFRILVVPDSLPKTKPKACNYGLNHAKGEFVVVYDAEDQPEPMQLKKAFLGFMDSPLDVFCLQAKLNYYNPNQNILTRLFTAEYSLWFDIVLPGLQSIQTSIPLGGTSNHFRTEALKKLEGWDPFNVAEDADLGARLFRAGYKTAIIDSVTLEEANSNVKNWIRQRSRWLKGYMQTYFVQMRNPLEFVREKKQHYFIFQLVSGLRVSFMLINPLLWAMTAAYFLLFKFVGPQIEALFPTEVFYMAGFSAVFGNFLYLYYYMIGAAKRNEWGIIKYIFLVPFYWLMASVGAFVAFYQLLVKPHFWEKTIHGLNVIKAKEVKAARRVGFSFIKNLGLTALPNIKAVLKPDYLSGMFLIVASMIVNVLNFIYNAYLSRKASLEDFGLITLFGSFVYILSVPISALSKTVTYKSAYLLGKHDSPVKQFWIQIRKKSIKISLILAILWLILTPILTQVFRADSILPFIIFIPILIIGFAGAVDGGFLTGNLFFTVSGIAIILEALARLTFTFLFVELGFTDLVYLATPISMLFSFFFVWLYILKIKNSDVKIEAGQYSFPGKFFASSIANKISTIAFLSLDIVMAKMFLTPEDAGRYAVLSLTGKMVYLVGSLFISFIIPIISKEEGTGSTSNKSFYKILGAATGSSFFAFLIFGVFGQYTTPILFGSKVYSIIAYLPLYAFAIFMQTVATSIVIFHQVKGRHTFSYLGFLFSLIQVFSIALVHRNIGDIVTALSIGGAIYLTSMILMHL